MPKPRWCNASISEVLIQEGVFFLEAALAIANIFIATN